MSINATSVLFLGLEMARCSENEGASSGSKSISSFTLLLIDPYSPSFITV
ncbi:MAG TPA: hypothetical protein VKA26_13950 [Ignavibacteriaceae bacterium]|nr:hypothetical protein [Ignavibacteriaceae bacterium]